jgi:hypothetical protein
LFGALAIVTHPKSVGFSTARIDFYRPRQPYTSLVCTPYKSLLPSVRLTVEI